MAKTSIFNNEEGRKQVLSFYETFLSQWHQPSTQVTLETNIGKPFIIESGPKEAPAVLLLHGAGSNAAMWTADVIELSKSYHVFAINIIGECGKSSENRPSFKTDHYSDWLLELFDKLGLIRASIIGCSLGGWIATDFAIKHPEKTEKLVLMATAGITQVKLNTIFWIIITSMMSRWGFNKLNKIVYGQLEMDDQVLAFATLVKKHFKPRTDVLPLFSDSSLQRIKASTLFIGGENDCLYPSNKTAFRLMAHLSDIQCRVLEHTGHVLLNQTKTIVQFLNN